MIPSLLIFAAVAAAGAYFLVRGLRVRRRGDTPRCARCDYELTGQPAAAESDRDAPRCPECGATLDARNVVRGDRYRRRPAAALGAVLLLAGLLPLGGLLVEGWRAIDWYRLRPARWLIDDVERAASARAMGELARRAGQRSLAASDRDRLVELALAEQGKPALGPLGPALIDFAGARADAGQLSEAQRERFFRQMARLSLRVRPRVGAGEQTPFLIAYAGRGPAGGGWRVRVAGEEVELGGRTQQLGGSAGVSGSGAAGSSGSSIVAPATPGRHTLTARARVQVLRGGGDGLTGEPTGSPVHEREVTLTADLDVVGRVADDAVEQVDDARLAPAIRAALQPQAFTFNAGDRTLRGQVEVVAPLPSDVAFDVFARAGGEEHPIGSVTFRAGAGGRVHHLQQPPGGDWSGPVSQVDVVLRSSEAAARRTVDMTSLWKGELVFQNVPVAAR